MFFSVEQIGKQNSKVFMRCRGCDAMSCIDGACKDKNCCWPYLKS